MHERLYDDAGRRAEKLDNSKKTGGALPNDFTFTPKLQTRPGSCGGGGGPGGVGSDGSSLGGRPRHELLYEDSLVRQERRRRLEEELKLRGGPDAIEAARMQAEVGARTSCYEKKTKQDTRTHTLTPAVDFFLT